MTRPKGEGPRNLAASIKARLLQKARKDGEEFNSILVRYVLERLLYRLANSPYADEFILKGALLFVVWSDRPHRATKDLDLLGSGTPDPLRLQKIFRQVCEVQVIEDGLVFLAETVTAEPIREEAVYDGIRLRFAARLGSARTPVQVDVGFGDVTTPEPLLTNIPVLDHPAPRLRAYARESAIAEKLHAMVELGLANSRMKDYYDVWFLSKFYAFDAEVLCRAVRATFERRQTAVSSIGLVPGNFAFVFNRRPRPRVVRQVRTLDSSGPASTPFPALQSSWRTSRIDMGSTGRCPTAMTPCSWTDLIAFDTRQYNLAGVLLRGPECSEATSAASELGDWFASETSVQVGNRLVLAFRYCDA